MVFIIYRCAILRYVKVHVWNILNQTAMEETARNWRWCIKQPEGLELPEKVVVDTAIVHGTHKYVYV